MLAMREHHVYEWKSGFVMRYQMLKRVGFALLAVLGLVAMVSLLSYNFGLKTSDHIHNNLLVLDSRTDTIVRNLETFSSYAFSRDIDTGSVTQLVARAWKSDAAERDAIRTELYQRILPVYQQMERYHFRQLHFHFPDSTSFLRMHSPDKYGDYLGDVRSTVKLVNQTKTPVTAFEEGRIFNGYRFVYPLFWQGQHCGSVEVSFSMSSFLTRLHSLRNCDYHFGVRRDVVESTVFDSNQSNYRESIFSANYMEDVGVTQEHQMTAAFDGRPPEFDALLAEGRNGGVVTMVDGQPVIILVSHIHNLEKVPVGVIISVDKDPVYATLRDDFFTLLAVSCAGYVALVLVVFLLYVERKRLRIISSTDSLTGLANRRTVTAVLEHELQRFSRYSTPLSVMILDIDDFKSMNDTYGHEEGDRVLRTMSAVMKDTLRATDTVGRWGGEEFIVILQNTPYESAMVAANKLRAAIARGPVSEKRAVTVSVGVASAGSNESMDSLVGRADTAMYHAKKTGKNRVSGSDPGQDNGAGLTDPGTSG